MTTIKASNRTFNAGYIGFDLRRNLRMFSTVFFAVGLPVMMFLIFGSMSEFSSTMNNTGRANVTAEIMVAMAVYGAVTASVTLSGSAAVELQQGWGRQLGLTPFSTGGYILSKVVVGLTFALLPIAAVYIAGAVIGARMDGWVWPASAGLILFGSIVFALYGLAFGLTLRSEAAVGAASGIVVVLMFIGNAFTPLTGFLLDISPYTPVWGVGRLAAWPLNDGVYYDVQAQQRVEYELWMPLVNIAVWATVFAIVCILGSRRSTGRR